MKVAQPFSPVTVVLTERAEIFFLAEILSFYRRGKTGREDRTTTFAEALLDEIEGRAGVFWDDPHRYTAARLTALALLGVNPDLTPLQYGGVMYEGACLLCGRDGASCGCDPTLENTRPFSLGDIVEFTVDGGGKVAGEVVEVLGNLVRLYVEQDGVIYYAAAKRDWSDVRVLRVRKEPLVPEEPTDEEGEYDNDEEDTEDDTALSQGQKQRKKRRRSRIIRLPSGKSYLVAALEAVIAHPGLIAGEVAKKIDGAYKKSVTAALSLLHREGKVRRELVKAPNTYRYYPKEGK